MTSPGVCAKVGGWTKTRPFSLGLLPSGPDPVGEWNVHRQPPGLYLAKDGLRRKGAPTFISGVSHIVSMGIGTRPRDASGRFFAQGDQRSASGAGRPDQCGKVEICREPQAGQMKLRPFSISGSGVEGSSDRVSKAIGVECRHIGLEQVTKKPGTPCD